ncbi:MAG: YjbQ family protein [Chloroflexi bacterium]|nr:YjbQ family protein [Chloroflexota bacterium]
MQISSAPAVAVQLRRLMLETREPIQFLDITDEVLDLVRDVGLRQGVVTIFSRHTTAAVCIQEDEPLLLEDLREFLQRSAPAHAHYRHNDFRVRTVHMHDDESPNGHAHCLQLMLGTSENVPVEHGELLLGTWQRIFVVELDGPRPAREVIIQAVGSAD